MRIGHIIFTTIFMLYSCPNLAQGRENYLSIVDLPDEWVSLTPTDSGNIVYNTCDSGNLLLRINRYNSPIKLLLYGQQEDYEFEVSNVEIINQDTLLIHTKWINSEELKLFKFAWLDEQKQLGNYYGTRI